MFLAEKNFVLLSQAVFKLIKILFYFIMLDFDSINLTILFNFFISSNLILRLDFNFSNPISHLIIISFLTVNLNIKSLANFI